jgi:hypothetical protein
MRLTRLPAVLSMVGVFAFVLALAPPAAGQIATNVVISELCINGTGSPENEFIELYNPTTSAVVFNSAADTLYTQNASGGNFRAIPLTGTIAARGFFLIANAAVVTPAPDIDFGVSFSLTNTGGSAILRVGGVTLDRVGWGAPLQFEGSPLPGSPAEPTSYERKAKNTSTVDSMTAGGADEFRGNGWDGNDNSADFITRPTTQGQNTASATEVPPSLANFPPSIGGVARTLFVAEVAGTDTVTATVNDGDGSVGAVRLHIRVNGGAFDSVAMTLVSGSLYRGVISASRHTAAGHLIEYFVSAVDNLGAYNATNGALQGYFVGDAPVDSIKSRAIGDITGYGARVNGTINVRTNTHSNGQGFIQDATGGLQLFLSGGLLPLEAGRHVKVQGTVGSFQGSYQLNAPNFAFVDTTLGSTTLTPAVITLPQALSATNDFEGRLVKINGLTTAATGSFTAPASYSYSDGDGDTVTVRVESNAGLNSLVGSPIPATATDVTGVLVWVTNHLRLKPRAAEDLGLTPNTLFAVTSGNWSNPATWGGTVPTTTNDVVINSLGVTVTVDIDSARCRNLTLTGSGSASNSGPVLEFQASGVKRLTLSGDLSISGGSGGGGGDRGGRPKLTSNGNTSAVLEIRGDIFTSSSNSTANGDAGLNMNEGIVRLTGATADTIRLNATCRLGDLVIGDGVAAKTVVTAPSTNSTISIRSLLVRQGSAFWIGTSTNTSTMRIGNFDFTGVPTLTGGVTVETGASLRVLESSAGFVFHTMNIDGGGITNNGTIDLVSAGAPELTGCVYAVRFGGSPVGTSGVAQSIGGAGTGEYADMSVDSLHTLTLNADVAIAPGYAFEVRNGTLAETAGNTVLGVATATRTLATGVAESFGGLGLQVNAAGAAPGLTTVSRTTGTPVVSGGSESILRWFDVTPAVNSGLNATLVFSYDNSELNGQTAAALQLWKSTSAGLTWSAQGGTPNPGARTITLAGVGGFSRWTAADTANTLGGSLTVGIPLTAGWNMISNPVVTAADSVTDLFPTSSFPYAFAFNPASGYNQQGRLLNGVGYWGKFPSGVTQSVSGDGLGLDSIPVASGWNMIGSLSTSVDTSTIVEVPSGIVSSQYFGYNAGYTASATIQPGKAYWVKASAAGTLVLGAALARPAVAPADLLEEFGTIRVRDAAGAEQVLRLGPASQAAFGVEMFEMPPAGPEGAFDARFASDRMVEVYSKGASAFPIRFRTTSYPVTVSWELAVPVLVGGTSGASGTVTIADPSIRDVTIAVAGEGGVPAEFSLAQNFPNPFNPSTTVRFGLPRDASVSLAVFNALGQRIAEVTPGLLAAGYHTASWDGRTLSGASAGSGVYFYTLRAVGMDGELFTATRKMMLLK